MKKYLLMLAFALTLTTQARAQEIFYEVKNMLDNYATVKADTSRNLEERKIATFKYDSIYYLIYKGGESTEYELGLHVMSMTGFVKLYLQQLKNAKGNENKQLVRMKFKAASLENTLYNDLDKETTYAYVDNDNFLTNFSLDTDWVAALEAVQ